jgi:hypothetical protein
MEAGVRTVVVRSPSVWRETGGVIRALLHIVLWSAAIMGATWGSDAASGGAPRATTLAVDEIAFRDLDADGQRMYRAALAGLTEAEDVRSRTGDWPAVEALAARRVPPFAPDPLDRAGYRWAILRDGLLVNYVGTPAKGPTIAIVIVEPARGMAADPQAIVDEQHHKLRDGTLLHVSIWTGAKPLTTPASTPAFEDGWRRITMN